jgi:hypothetical protein
MSYLKADDVRRQMTVTEAASMVDIGASDLSVCRRRKGVRYVAAALAVSTAAVFGIVGLPASAEAAASLQCPNSLPGYTVIVGTSGGDDLEGTPGDDHICGLGGADTIRGLAGDDMIYGADGDDTIVGGDGDDLIEGGEGGDHIDAGLGRDTVYGDFIDSEPVDPTRAADVILLGEGADFGWGGPGDDIMNSGGSSLAESSLHADDMVGENGDDMMTGGIVTMSDQFHGEAGNDFIYPSPIAVGGSVTGNLATGGTGNDVAILVNGRGLPKPDVWNPDDTIDIPITPFCSIGSSEVVDGTRQTVMSCEVPWLRAIGGSGGPLSVSVEIDESGTVTSLEGELYDGLATVQSSPQQIDDLRSWQRTLESDICICDPLNSFPAPSSWSPYDIPL